MRSRFRYHYKQHRKLPLHHLINAAFRCCLVSKSVILVQNSKKSPNDNKSYRAIFLLSEVSRFFEKVLLKRWKPLIKNNRLVTNYEFGFPQTTFNIKVRADDYYNNRGSPRRNTNRLKCISTRSPGLRIGVAWRPAS